MYVCKVSFNCSLVPIVTYRPVTTWEHVTKNVDIYHAYLSSNVLCYFVAAK